MLQFITAPQSTLQTQPPHMNITGKRPYHLMNNTNKALEIHSTRCPDKSQSLLCQTANNCNAGSQCRLSHQSHADA
jgi:hypothetical protein